MIIVMGDDEFYNIHMKFMMKIMIMMTYGLDDDDDDVSGSDGPWIGEWLSWWVMMILIMMMSKSGCWWWRC